jgi:hypothetical protein
MRFRLPAYLAIGVAGVVLAGCGSSSSSSTQTTKAPSPTAAAIAQIKRNWVAFFSPKTSPSAKEALLQNGTQFAPVITAQSKSPLAAQSAAKVNAVRLTSPSTATVTYTVLLAGKPALPHTTGTAVKANGTWQVSDASFCQLLKLEGPAPPGCPKG